jgi:hypothetical protein
MPGACCWLALMIQLPMLTRCCAPLLLPPPTHTHTHTQAGVPRRQQAVRPQALRRLPEAPGLAGPGLLGAVALPLDGGRAAQAAVRPAALGHLVAGRVRDAQPAGEAPSLLTAAAAVS